MDKPSNPQSGGPLHSADQRLQKATIFCLPLAPNHQADQNDWELLSADERARADRFVVPEPRTQFIRCRAALRRLLAERLNCVPAQIVFRQQNLGKPELDAGRTLGNTFGQTVRSNVKDRNLTLPQDTNDANPASAAKRTQVDVDLPSAIHFNVSHSGNWGLIALGESAMGVDIERLQPRIHVQSLKNLVVSQIELAQWNSLSDATGAEQMIRLWVCKEALLKAMGLGIAQCLQQISFPMPISDASTFCPTHIDPSIQLHLPESRDCRCHKWLAAQSWSVHPLKIDKEYFAVAVTAANTEVEVRLQN